MTTPIRQRLSPECKAYIIQRLNTWPITTDDLQRACVEEGFQMPTYAQIRRIELELNRKVPIE